MQDFRNLKVWQKAHALTLAAYKATTKFPGDERFGLTIQVRRTASSIPTNIAEGTGRATDAEFLRCLSLAMGAGSQLEYQLLLSHDLGYLPAADHTQLTTDVIEVKRMIAGLIHSING
jgi:four helix bundle protein